MQRSRRQGLGVWLLFYQLFGVIGVNNIPPTTLIITALQVLIFLRIIPVPWHGPADVCISVDSVWNRKHWIRLFYGAVEHGNDWHLYYNMISFVWKGMSLERRFGSARFAYLISVFTALCSATLVGLCQLANEYFDRQYYHQCAVGFSSVLFALKVLTTHYWPHESPHLMGFRIDMPVRYLVWAELLLIQILVPNASFLGHLAGILVGLSYIHTPVGLVIDYGWQLIRSVLFDAAFQPNRGRFYSNNRMGEHSRPERFVPQGMTEDEQFEFAQQESLRSEYNRNQRFSYNQSPPYPNNNRGMPSAPYPDQDPHRANSRDLPYPEHDNFPRPSNSPPTGLYPDLDTVRQERLKRFQ